MIENSQSLPYKDLGQLLKVDIGLLHPTNGCMLTALYFMV